VSPFRSYYQLPLLAKLTERPSRTLGAVQTLVRSISDSVYAPQGPACRDAVGYVVEYISFGSG
jgi:hypothetical protein